LEIKDKHIYVVWNLECTLICPGCTHITGWVPCY